MQVFIMQQSDKSSSHVIMHKWCATLNNQCDAIYPHSVNNLDKKTSTGITEIISGLFFKLQFRLGMDLQSEAKHACYILDVHTVS